MSLPPRAQIRAVLLDLDGTLLDTADPASRQAFRSFSIMRSCIIISCACRMVTPSASCTVIWPVASMTMVDVPRLGVPVSTLPIPVLAPVFW
jgi:hypothetical protein